MRKLLISILTISSFSAFAVDTGNVCTVALYEKNSDNYGNPIPGKALGVTAVINTTGTSGEFGKLYNVSKKRAVIVKSLIDMNGLFIMTIQEVDQDKDGFLTFTNSKSLTAEKTYYSPYPEEPADNRPVVIEMENYVATLSCVLYKKI